MVDIFSKKINKWPAYSWKDAQNPLKNSNQSISKTPPRSAQVAEAAEQLGQGPTGLHLHPGGGAVPYPSVHWSCQETAGHPGVLTQAYRSIGGTSSSQRQQDHLTPEITRWQKANIRILPTESKITWHHQNPVFPPQQSWIPQHTGKAKFGFKIISHAAGRGF